MLAMLRERRRSGTPNLDGRLDLEEWCTRITRDCRLPGTLRKIPAALAASKQGFLAFLDPASLASILARRASPCEAEGREAASLL